MVDLKSEILATFGSQIPIVDEALDNPGQFVRLDPGLPLVHLPLDLGSHLSFFNIIGDFLLGML